jgi:hypothetical protein
MKYTEEELNDLTEEERAAILEEDDALDEQELDDEDMDTDAEDEDAGEEGEEADEPDADTGELGEAEAEEGEDEPEPAIPTLLTGDLPDDIQEKLDTLNQQKSDLATKFEDGDLSAAEYQTELDKLMKQERQIEQQQFKAQIAQEMKENAQREQWAATIQEFLTENPRYNTSKLLYQALDTAVREVAGEEESAGMTGKQILRVAHERVMAEIGITEEAKPVKQEKGKKYKPNIPPTLGSLPAAEQTETGNSKFKRLDEMMERNPEAFEEAFARLPEAEQEAYLASQ